MTRGTLTLFSIERDGSVYKVGVNSIKQNKNEIKLWKDLQDNQKQKFLLPILNYSKDFHWIKFRKAYNIIDSNEKLTVKYAENIRRKLQEEDYTVKEFSLGIYSGRYVLVDYGLIEM